MSVHAVAKLCRSRGRADEYVIHRTNVRHAEISATLVREREQTTFVVDLYRDLRRGRGHSRCVFGQSEMSIVGQRIADAGKLAAASLGPAWTLPAASAPAAVRVLDENLAKKPLEAARQGYARYASRLGQETKVGVLVENHSVMTSNQVDFRFASTRLELEWSGGERTARRARDLPAPAALAERANAPTLEQRTPPALYNLALAAHAMASPRLAPYGLFMPLVAQVQAERHRVSTPRFLLGQEVGAPPDLIVRSNGTIDYAMPSRPFGPDGTSTRNFDLVRGGRLAGLARDARDAGLSGLPANGGVRSLEINAGNAHVETLLAPGQHPTLIVEDLLWLTWDPDAGTLVFGIGHARLRSGGDERPVRGGTAQLDVFDLLAGTRSREMTADGVYRGPRYIRISPVQVL